MIDRQVEIDQASPDQWSQLLDEFEDSNLYQTRAFGTVLSGEGNLSHLVVREQGKAIGLAQVRIVRPGGLKYGVAFVRWGPIFHRKGTELRPEAAEATVRAMYDEYVVRRRLFLRVLPQALEGTPRAAALQAAFGRFSSESFAPGQTYRTMVLDLSPSLETLRKQFDPKWRNHLNRSEKNGLKIIEGTEIDVFGRFVELYNEMLSRKNFDGASDMQSFVQMQEQLPPHHRMRIFICTHEDIPAAGVVCTALGNTAIYLHGATNDRGLACKGAYFLQWRAIQWLKENGIRHYNLGGINPVTNPGVYSYKRGFGGADVLYLPPFAACESAPSRVIAKAGGYFRDKLRQIAKGRAGGGAPSTSPTPTPTQATNE